eukprot:354874-Rhodomonas_salina.1
MASAVAVLALQTVALASSESFPSRLAFAPTGPFPFSALRPPPHACRRPASPLSLSAKKSLKEILREEEDELKPNEPLGRNLDPEKEFQLNRGLAVDTLLQDYPYLLSKAPDFSIFRKEIILQDSQGFSIQGLQAYQLFFGVLRRISAAVFASAHVSCLLMDKCVSLSSSVLALSVDILGCVCLGCAECARLCDADTGTTRARSGYDGRSRLTQRVPV